MIRTFRKVLVLVLSLFNRVLIFTLPHLFYQAEQKLPMQAVRERNQLGNHRRCLSRAPVGEGAGINLYSYFGNDPVDYADPLGFPAQKGGVLGRRDLRGPNTGGKFEGFKNLARDHLNPPNPVNFQGNIRARIRGTNSFEPIQRSIRALDWALPAPHSNGIGHQPFLPCSLLERKDAGMNAKCKIVRRLLSTIPFYLGTPFLIYASQMVYWHDASGNLLASWQDPTTQMDSWMPDQTQTVGLSNQISLSVMQSGTGNATYQWRLNGANIVGATNATLFKAQASPIDSGLYSVVVTGGGRSETNQAGTITVLATTNTLYGIAYGLGQYIAVGENGTIAVSPDLVNWRVFDSCTNSQLEAITFANNLFVAVGRNSTVVTSSDGSNWVARTSGTTNNLKGIAFGNGVFLAVGSGGTTLTSPDGVSWTRQTFDYPTLEAVTYATNMFVAVGTGGTIWTSLDGTNWSSQSWTTNVMLNAVTYGNGVFVAAGTNGTILISADGSNWSQQSTGTQESFESALFFQNTLFALGPVAKNYVFSNGTNWGLSAGSTLQILFASIVGSNNAVAVGRNGAITRISTFLLEHFEWSAIPIAQRVNQAFSATITAKDAANTTATNFNGTVSISATSLQLIMTNTILSNLTHTAITSGATTAGYMFTPNTDLLVTHFRHYWGSKVSIWSDEEELLASMSVLSIPGTWVETELPATLVLKAGQSYVVGVYSNTNVFYRADGANTFRDGTIEQALAIAGDGFPYFAQDAFWYAVDIKYVVRRTLANTPSPLTATLVNGTTNVSVSFSSAAEQVLLRAEDGAGHSGFSNPFNVYGSNDLGVTVVDAPNPASMLEELVYTATVVNSGPNSATNVWLTNTLPQNVNFESAIPSQGSCQLSNGIVTCAIGTLGNGQSATVTIRVVPTAAGLMLTNTTFISRASWETSLVNNNFSLKTYIPPILVISNRSLLEGNFGVKTNEVLLALTSPSILPVSFKAVTSNGTAHAGTDYVLINDSYFIPPGSVTAGLPVGIQGDTSQELDEYFRIYITDVTNATLYNSHATVTILNDDGLPNQIQRLVWNTISSPQRTNHSIQVTITAKDAFNSTATTFTNAGLLRGVSIGGSDSRTLLTNDVHASSANLALYSLGYEFTPATNLFVTHVRHYFGSKVSLWTDEGFILASANVASVLGQWTETELATPVYLEAGKHYRLSAFSDGAPYYWCVEGASMFTNGTIDHSYYGVGDSFPNLSDTVRWYMVDLRYTLAADISPSVTGNFTNGVWAGNVEVHELGTNFTLMADDGDGHIGYANRFGVYQMNDLAVTITNSPAVVLVNTNLIYIVRVMNAGTNSSTGVSLTNTLPTDFTNVAFSVSQGSCVMTNGIITCNLGTIANLSSASLTVTGTPPFAGSPLTNSAVVARNEEDPNPTNNEAVSVVTASISLSLQLQAAADYFGSTWISGLDATWTNQAAVTHDGTNAVQSGLITHNQQSTIGMTIRGPGTLNFWWKVSSQQGYDGLVFTANGTSNASISGEVDWQQKIYLIPTGVFNLQWKYLKDGSISVGSDAGWLDEVNYSVPPFYLSPPNYTNILGTKYVFLTLTGTNGQRLITQGSSEFIRWHSIATNTLASNTLTLQITAPYDLRFYRTVHRNE